MKPLPTHYAGCHFRSRLEARWAVFFSRLNVEWEYEPDAFATSAGNYWPDFRIKFGLIARSWMWFEVKRDDAPRDRRHTALVGDSGQALIVARGLPGGHAEQSDYLTMLYRSFDGTVRTGRTSGFQVHISDRVNGRGFTELDYPQSGDDSWIVDAAYEAARSERFGW